MLNLDLVLQQIPEAMNQDYRGHIFIYCWFIGHIVNMSHEISGFLRIIVDMSGPLSRDYTGRAAGASGSVCSDILRVFTR